ncbi:hypothetical protein B9Z19DRAFT_1097184 [Tuber borchii]|uniref:Uncharacterized protein n=1 Tax=Tuber borchii TaxID=42251 RepID=A0A2T6ZAH6_TUBBO|nr:hypothetical protein B9Z19DRAFT_1097184 [Tuber borchii]
MLEQSLPKENGRKEERHNTTQGLPHIHPNLTVTQSITHPSTLDMRRLGAGGFALLWGTVSPAAQNRW